MSCSRARYVFADIIMRTHIAYALCRGGSRDLKRGGIAASSGKLAVSVLSTSGVWGMPPRKILDFRPSGISFLVPFWATTRRTAM